MVRFLCAVGVVLAGLAIVSGWGLGCFAAAGVLASAFWIHTDPRRVAERRDRRRGGMLL